jgi:nucleotide-binding universal stress UspA family protein
MPFKKILVPVDFSPHSHEALRVAAELSSLYGAPLTVVSVFQPMIYPLPEGMIAMPADTVARAMTDLTMALARAGEQASTAGGVGVETQLLQGAPFTEIVRAAREGGFDLIVMGTHGRTGLQHALLGSVAEKVVRKAPCAVLAVRMPSHRFEHP